MIMMRFLCRVVTWSLDAACAEVPKLLYAVSSSGAVEVIIDGNEVCMLLCAFSGAGDGGGLCLRLLYADRADSNAAACGLAELRQALQSFRVSQGRN